MRHVLIILLLLLAPAFCHASAAGVPATPAQEAFNSVYGADVQRVKAGRDAKAAAELATRLLATVKEFKSQPAFQVVLCEKAYEVTQITADPGKGIEKIGIVSPELPGEITATPATSRER